jgi:hypothetical protein
MMVVVTARASIPTTTIHSFNKKGNILGRSMGMEINNNTIVGTSSSKSLNQKYWDIFR